MWWLKCTIVVSFLGVNTTSTIPHWTIKVALKVNQAARNVCLKKEIVSGAVMNHLQASVCRKEAKLARANTDGQNAVLKQLITEKEGL